MKLDIEILQTQNAALQTFVNSSEASVVGFDIIQEVTRLKCDLIATKRRNLSDSNLSFAI